MRLGRDPTTAKQQLRKASVSAFGISIFRALLVVLSVTLLSLISVRLQALSRS